MRDKPITLSLGELEADVFPGQGAVLGRLSLAGNELLCKTPWANQIVEIKSETQDESSWVANWRGGWQLCAPNVGYGKTSGERVSFHGLASQANWLIVEESQNYVTLQWLDPEGVFRITRTWELRSIRDVTAITQLENLSAAPVPVAVAEHLILGSASLGELSEDSLVHLSYSPEVEVVELDYSAWPTGKVFQNPSLDSQWFVCSKRQPARVFSLLDLSDKKVTVFSNGYQLVVSWVGLPHALIWQEFGTSSEKPWNNSVFALGVEPTNIPHGAGANAVDGPFISAGGKMNWSTTLTVSKHREGVDD